MSMRNLGNRPKRSIHSKNLAVSDDLFKQLDNSIFIDTDESDEDYDPLKKSNLDEDDDVKNGKSDNDDNDEDEEDDDEDDDDDDDDDDDEDDDSDEDVEMIDSNDQERKIENGFAKNYSLSKKEAKNENVEVEGLNLNNHESAKLDQNSSKRSKTNSTKKSNIKNEKCSNNSSSLEEKNDEKKENKKRSKKRKPRKNKTKLAREYDSDKDTQKLIDSFRNSKITKKSKQTKPIQKTFKKELNSTLLNEETKCEQRINSGPYVKLIKRKYQDTKSKTNNSAQSNDLNTNTIEYSSYVVCQHQPIENTLDEKSIQKTANSQSNQNNLITNNRLPKDRLHPIKDQKSEWLCSLCFKKPHYIAGVGDLYGPYRVSSDFENDLNYGENDSNESNDIREIWLHEGCTVWSPNTYVKDNHLKGVAALMKSSQKRCSSCSKPGASLSCSCNSCNNVYHYPCAILNQCLFNYDSLSIQCGIH